MSQTVELTQKNARLSAQDLKDSLLAVGADDVGFVAIDRPELDDQREDILRVFPKTKTLISFVVKMNREPIKSPARSLANREFHLTGDVVDEVGHEIVRSLQDQGIAALNPPMGFPMEMDNFPGKLWVVSHKPVAVAAGLGHMGIHRCVIHPKFGNFILLGTILVAAEVDEESTTTDWNPCLECKLCVAACPVGAISSQGDFDFSACYTHNYREFMGGFTDWAEQIASSKTAVGYRKKVTDKESASMWQSLSFGANYKAAYCMSVCPAGEDVIGPYLESKTTHLKEVVKPLQKKEETIYVLENSDAKDHVKKRFPHKQAKVVGNGLRVGTAEGFLKYSPLVFQSGKAGDLNVVYHFRFTGSEELEATITIRNKKISVEEGLIGEPDLVVTADSQTWVKFLRHERSIVRALITRKVKIKGAAKLLIAFGKCFPM